MRVSLPKVLSSGLRVLEEEEEREEGYPVTQPGFCLWLRLLTDVWPQQNTTALCATYVPSSLQVCYIQGGRLARNGTSLPICVRRRRRVIRAFAETVCSGITARHAIKHVWRQRIRSLPNAARLVGFRQYGIKLSAEKPTRTRLPFGSTATGYRHAAPLRLARSTRRRQRSRLASKHTGR
jgi:hypothetical protein